MRTQTFLRRAFSVFVLGPSLLLTAFGCSSGGGGGGGGVAASRDQFISQYCAELTPCCAKAGLPSDGSSCRLFLGVYAPTTYDAVSGNACLDEIRAASASATFCDSSSGTSSSSSCKKVFGSSSSGGTVAPGGKCTQDKDCAASAEGSVACASVYTSGAEIRKCQVQLVGKAGDSPCVGTVDGSSTSYSYSSSVTDVAPKGYLCDVKDGIRCDSTSGKCTAISAIGGHCTGSSSDCVKDAFCDFKSNTCVPKLAAGSPCDAYGNQCAAGTYCDATAKKCTTALADGAPCTTSTPCLSSSCVNGACAKKSDLGLTMLCGT